MGKYILNNVPEIRKRMSQMRFKKMFLAVQLFICWYLFDYPFFNKFLFGCSRTAQS